jgi:hypothetical protein
VENVVERAKDVARRKQWVNYFNAGKTSAKTMEREKQNTIANLERQIAQLKTKKK